VELPLARVAHVAVDMPGLRFLSSPKIVLSVAPAATATATVATMATTAPVAPMAIVKLSFRLAGAKERVGAYAAALERAVAAKRWAGAAPAAAPAAPAAPVSAMGILGIQRAKAEQLRQGGEEINAAFKGDLSALMARAKGLVVLAERYKAKLQARQSQGQAGGEEGADAQGDAAPEEDAAMLQSLLFSLGMPVTRETHGSGVRYHRELARELASFLVPVLQRKPQGTGLWHGRWWGAERERVCVCLCVLAVLYSAQPTVCMT
jgi:hypothetical protein